MRCLVTGASGFLGSHLVRKLVEDGHSVTVLLRPGSDAWRLDGVLSQVRCIEGSLKDAGKIAGGLREEPVEVAFHLAWSGVTGEERNSAEQITRNVPGSLALWRVLRDTGCETLISVGSQAEYGPHCGILHERLPTNPVTAYGVAKAALCALLQRLCVLGGMRFVWLRLLSAYGPADDERHMVPSLIRALLRRERPALTAGEQIWDYLYVADAASALCAAMESRTSGVFNLGSGRAIALREFILAVRDCIDSSLPLGFGETPYRPDQVMHLEADISALRAATGWAPKIAIEEGVRRTVEWYRDRSNEGA
jgi:nucleoside-diphosphate-sugar epimerase